jgi:hypothetical protein
METRQERTAMRIADMPPRLRRRLLLAGLAAALALAASQAVAQGGRVRFYGAALPGSGDAYGSGVMNQNDLEHCVRLEHEINAGAGAMEAEEARIAAGRAEIEGLNREIEQSAARLDRNNRPAVKRHDALVERQRAAAADFNARLPAFNARARRHNARMNEFNTGCAANRFYEADMRAVRTRLMLD